MKYFIINLYNIYIVLITSPAGAAAKYCDEYVCVGVCLSVCPSAYLGNHMRDLYQIFVHVAYVRSSVLLRHVDDRPHRLSPGRGDGSAQRGRSVIYDCLVFNRVFRLCLFNVSLFFYLCNE